MSKIDMTGLLLTAVYQIITKTVMEIDGIVSAKSATKSVSAYQAEFS